MPIRCSRAWRLKSPRPARRSFPIRPCLFRAQTKRRCAVLSRTLKSLPTIRAGSRICRCWQKSIMARLAYLPDLIFIWAKTAPGLSRSTPTPAGICSTPFWRARSNPVAMPSPPVKWPRYKPRPWPCLPRSGDGSVALRLYAQSPSSMKIRKNNTCIRSSACLRACSSAQAIKP